MKIDLQGVPSFGVAGNFTGHLEQAGEAKDFNNVTTAEVNAPKAVFPTYIPGVGTAPEFLRTYPWDHVSIIYPENQNKLQIEPECAILFDATWNDDQLVALSPVAFGASNDCSIRRDGATKISQKKNWGPSSKGFSDNAIALPSFDADSIINDYRIACFLVRDGIAYEYGEDSYIKDYSYVYGKLTNWLIDKFNNQQCEGPAEDIHSYLVSTGCPNRLLVSIGATRYTDYGEKNYLTTGDKSVVILYPDSKYKKDDIVAIVTGKAETPDDISLLSQTVLN